MMSKILQEKIACQEEMRNLIIILYMAQGEDSDFLDHLIKTYRKWPKHFVEGTVNIDLLNEMNNLNELILIFKSLASFSEDSEKQQHYKDELFRILFGSYYLSKYQEHDSYTMSKDVYSQSVRIENLIRCCFPDYSYSKPRTDISRILSDRKEGFKKIKKPNSNIKSINFDNIQEKGGKNRLYHPYHLVDSSPWPLLSSIAILFFAINIVEMLVNNNLNNILYCTFLLITILSFWWRDVIREGIGGFHTKIVQTGILIGFLLFLISEIMIFFSLFWCFFHSSLAPAIELGSVWPPVGIRALNPWAIPLLGTCILLGSGLILTEAHHATILGNKKNTLSQVYVTTLLGFLFLCLQGLEYYWGEFTIADSVYGSIFYCTTSLHGLHVLMGVLFILTNFIRIYFDYITTTHHKSYEFSIYYWHLVDIIWIIVFILYYYGSY